MTARMPDELACRQMVQLVTDYLEGALSLDDRTRFEQHLVFCKGCAAYVRQMREMLRIAGRIEPSALPHDVQRDLLEAFRAWKGSKP
ncbi:MAG TPA: zf-HC2 domain-containing protein [Myxococcales bacterium]|nr:zf-HC2 domain-containing protein [Myxococcales bacterium]